MRVRADMPPKPPPPRRMSAETRSPAGAAREGRARGGARRVFGEGGALGLARCRGGRRWPAPCLSRVGSRGCVRRRGAIHGAGSRRRFVPRRPSPSPLPSSGRWGARRSACRRARRRPGRGGVGLHFSRSRAGASSGAAERGVVGWSGKAGRGRGGGRRGWGWHGPPGWGRGAPDPGGGWAWGWACDRGGGAGGRVRAGVGISRVAFVAAHFRLVGWRGGAGRACRPTSPASIARGRYSPPGARARSPDRRRGWRGPGVPSVRGAGPPCLGGGAPVASCGGARRGRGTRRRGGGGWTGREGAGARVAGGWGGSSFAAGGGLRPGGGEGCAAGEGTPAPPPQRARALRGPFLLLCSTKLSPGFPGFHPQVIHKIDPCTVKVTAKRNILCVGTLTRAIAQPCSNLVVTQASVTRTRRCAMGQSMHMTMLEDLKRAAWARTTSPVSGTQIEFACGVPQGLPGEPRAVCRLRQPPFALRLGARLHHLPRVRRLDRFREHPGPALEGHRSARRSSSWPHEQSRGIAAQRVEPVTR